MLLLALQLHSAPQAAPRFEAAALLVAAVVALWLITRVFASRASKPPVLWCMAGYMALIHVVALLGLVTGPLFGDGLTHLTLLTFPFSMSVAGVDDIPGFATWNDLATNYVRYILLFGTMNSLILGGFLALILPGRPAPVRSPGARR